MSPKYPVAAVAVVAAAVAAGAGVLVPATNAQTPAAEDQAPDALTVQFRHREAKVTLVDLPPKMTRRRPSESPGDLAVGSARLRNASGAVIGEMHQSFMITGGRGEATTELITATLVLGDGQVTLQGLADNRKPDAPLIAAITGGTGRYDGSAGSAHVRESPTAVAFELRFTR